MAASSSLSDLSTVSSPASFRTAFQSPEAAEAMNAPVVSAPSYSLAIQLPRELKDHCQIYLEEHLYNGALGLLNSLLTAGSSQSRHASKKRNNKKPVYVPPSTHLALLNTLSIHPSHTTRAAGADRLEVGAQAFDYMRNLLAIVGPINGSFREAFHFEGRNRYHDDKDDEMEDDYINNKMAVEDSIWHRAHDFWAVVGWAFNCSAAHPHRWRFWKTWLEFMFDVLAADLKERKRMDEEAAHPSQNSEWTNVRDSILVAYIRQKADSNRNGLKMIIHAIFADGYAQSLSKFPEIFNKETKGLPSEDKKRKRLTALDIENDQFGDYFNDDLDSDPSDVESPSTYNTPQTPRRNAGDFVKPGVAESIPLRLRLAELLSEVAMCLPTCFMRHHEYTTDLCRTLEQQPLSFFQQFVSETGAHLGRAFELDVLTTQLDLILPSFYMDPALVVSAGSGIVVNADVLELCYLPHTATSVEADENARLALILENLLHHLSVGEIRAAKDRLRMAAAKGIEARKAKLKPPRRGKKTSNRKDEFAREMMHLVGERILLYIDIMGAVSDDCNEDEEMKD